VRSKGGFTPLRIAKDAGLERIAELLQKNGAKE
jgi:hypothetical protein